MPVANAARKLKEMKRDEVLEVLADDEGIKVDMPAWCRATGHGFLGIVEEKGEIRVYVRKQGKD